MIAAITTLEEEGDSRKHPNLKLLDSLNLTYPGFERDKREAEAVHSGNSKLALGFDAAIRRLRVKQRAYEEQKSMKTIHRSHPNLVALDALELSYPGWQQDHQKMESAHNKNPNCDFTEMLRKIQVKQLRYENDRTHYRLKEIDSLELSYPGWKADLRNLEKFHFEQAFFLPGDSLFQSKLDGLRRRQQIYLRSQKVKANRMGQQAPEEADEDSVVVVNQREKPSCVTSPKPEAAASYLLRRAPSEDRQPARAPYAVILDTDSFSESVRTPAESVVRAPAEPARTPVESARTPVDPPNRPDPPERDNESFSGPPAPKTRQSIDCDETVSNTLHERGATGIDCDEQITDDELEETLLEEETKSDPQGFIGDEGLHLTNTEVTQCPWPSKLSSYVDLAPICEPEDSDESGTNEENEDISELPQRTRSYNYSTPTQSSAKPYIMPKGIYSAPPMPLCEEDGKSLTSRALSAAATPSSSRAVYTSDISASAWSDTSTHAVWSGEESLATGNRSGVSVSSSRAVWAESPSPYVAQTPSSMRPLQSVSSTPRERDSAHRPATSRSRGSTSERIRKTRRANEDRSRRNAEDRSRRASEDGSRISRTSSKSASQSSGRSKKLGRCTICGDPDKNHVFVPCGHLCVCKQCAHQVISRQMSCPVCRGKVTEAIQVFL